MGGSNKLAYLRLAQSATVDAAGLLGATIRVSKIPITPGHIADSSRLPRCESC